MYGLEPYRNGIARLRARRYHLPVAGMARRRQTVIAKLCRCQTRAILSAVIPQGTPGIRGIPDGYFPDTQWVSMGVVQEMNYGSPKSRNVGSDLERRPFRRVLHSRHGFSRHHAPFGAQLRRSRRDPEPRLGFDPDRVPKRSRANNGQVRDQVGIS
jgi:hypothetical protein